MALLGERRAEAGAEERPKRSGREGARRGGAGFSLGFGQQVFEEMAQPDGQGNGTTGPSMADGGGAPSGAPVQQQQQAEQFVDRIVKQRLEQAFSSMFGKLIDSSERAARAAEQQAGSQRSDNMVRSLKVDAWKPQGREEELRTWREWWFSFQNYLIAHDQGYEDDFKNIDLDTEVDHALLPDEMVQRSQKLYSLLCSLLKGRPLLLVRALETKQIGL